MTKFKISYCSRIGALLFGAMLLAACNDIDDPVPLPSPAPASEPTSKIFQVEVTNLTNSQPLSPIALVLHAEGALWQLNQASSVALENLAESGDNSQLRALSVVLQSEAGAGALGSGMTENLTLETAAGGTLYLSLATMLVNTNDAFTGFSRIDVTNMVVGDSLRRTARAYDAGTESNSEMSGTIPGPADGGEGYNSTRDDVDFVALHAGVVSVDDGLNQSVLNESHRFDNPVISYSVTRTQ